MFIIIFIVEYTLPIILYKYDIYIYDNMYFTIIRKLSFVITSLKTKTKTYII